MKTKVIFRKFKYTESIIAIFPELTYPGFTSSKSLCMDYMHVGQHGESCYSTIMKITYPAVYPEYTDLFMELRNKEGYNLEIVTKKEYEKSLTII